MSIFNDKKHSFISQIGPPKMMILGFATVIIIGAIFLSLPISSASGEFTNFLDCLFTATSAVCVTGLTVVDTSIYWSTFGKVIIIILIQIGGLGFMTLSTSMAFILRKKINLRQRVLIKEQFNETQLSGIVLLVKKVLIITFLIEGIGAIILSTVFIPQFGIIKGIGFSLFHSISAFCNAGFDLMGKTSGEFSSIIDYYNNPIIVFTISTLIIVGGLGFGVIISIAKPKLKFAQYTIGSKIAIITTIILIILGTFFIFAGEFTNPASIQNLSFWDKLQVSYFQSVTTRTAGFATIDLTTFRESTILIMILLMFIGASPGSTGGGIKTTTFAVLLMTLKSLFKNEKEITVFRRRIELFIAKKATGIFFIAVGIISTATYLLMITQYGHYSLTECLFESVSAFATVGLSIAGTPNFNAAGRIIIMFLMFAGRIGTLTLFSFLVHTTKTKPIRYPKGKITVG